MLNFNEVLDYLKSTEIFPTSESKNDPYKNGVVSVLVNMTTEKEDKNGYKYDLKITLYPTGGCVVSFGKWSPMHAALISYGITDMDFLKEIVAYTKRKIA